MQQITETTYKNCSYNANLLIRDRGNIDISLIKKYVLSEGCTVTFVNLFRSFPLLVELSELRIGGLGTLR